MQAVAGVAGAGAAGWLQAGEYMQIDFCVFLLFLKYFFGIFLLIYSAAGGL